MANFEDIASLSILPIVNLNDINKPCDGIFLKVGKTCKKNFGKNDACKLHYASFVKENLENPVVKQCPFGYTSLGFGMGHLKCALTMFIPFPRTGGEEEKKRAQQHVEAKVSQENVILIYSALKKIYEKLMKLHENTIKNESMALHEIRKLNRNVKQTAERLYRTNPTQELLKILKASELMSKQFDVIEIIANESLAEIPPNTVTQVYKILDKCVHIFQTSDERIKIFCQSGYLPQARVSDKTFPIIPTVLIGNALKYSPDGSGIGITMEREGNECLVKISNVVKPGVKLTENIFKRGVRGDYDSDGSGNGLYVAQLIARQHGFQIHVQSNTDNRGITRCIFYFKIRTVNDLD